MRRNGIFVRILRYLMLGAAAISPLLAISGDPVIYSVYRGVDLGNSNEPNPKDYYVSVGTAQGVREGATLEVLRRVSTYDITTEKLYKDVTFPIAHLRVIHSEPDAAIARLEKMLPADKTPAMNPRAVMIGDFVRISE